MATVNVSFEGLFDKNYDHLDENKTAEDYVKYIVNKVCKSARTPNYSKDYIKESNLEGLEDFVEICNNLKNTVPPTLKYEVVSKNEKEDLVKASFNFDYIDEEKCDELIPSSVNFVQNHIIGFSLRNTEGFWEDIQKRFLDRVENKTCNYIQHEIKFLKEVKNSLKIEVVK